MAKKKKSLKHDENRRSKICIGIILLAFVVVMSGQIKEARQKQLEKIALEEELKKQ